MRRLTAGRIQDAACGRADSVRDRAERWKVGESQGEDPSRSGCTAEVLRSEIEGKRARIRFCVSRSQRRRKTAKASLWPRFESIPRWSRRRRRARRWSNASALQKAREEQDAVGQRRRELDAMKSRLSAIAADVDGARLSIRGLEASVAARRRQVASQQGRLACSRHRLGLPRPPKTMRSSASRTFRLGGAHPGATPGRSAGDAPPPVIPPAPRRAARRDTLLARLQPKGTRSCRTHPRSPIRPRLLTWLRSEPPAVPEPPAVLILRPFPRSMAPPR